MEITEMVKDLSTCRNLQALDLSGNNLGNGIHKLIENMSTQTLKTLYLADIKITPDCCERWLRELAKCKNLANLSLEGNNLTGQLSHFLSDHGSTLPSLRQFNADKRWTKQR